MTTKKVITKKNSAMTPEVVTTNPAQMEIPGNEISPTLPGVDPEIGDPRETDNDPGGFIDEARRDDLLDRPAPGEWSGRLEDGMIIESSPDGKITIERTGLEWPLRQDQKSPFDLQTEYFDPESMEVMNSHQYVKNGIPLPRCNDFLQPIFADLLRSDLTDVRITVRGSKPVEVGEEGTLLKSYARVSLVYEIVDNEEFHMSIGFVYALDQANPIIKVFSGVKVSACTNLCIFGANDIEKYNILSNRQGAYEKFREYITNAREKYIQYKILINYLKSNSIEFKDLHRFYGTLCQRFTAVKNISGTNVILNSFQLIQQEKSDYFVRADGSCSLWNLYNSMTDDYRGKTDLLDQPEKVLSLFRECESFTKTNPDLIAVSN